MRHFAFLLIIASGCVTTRTPSLSDGVVADIISEIAVRYAVMRSTDDTPAPPTPDVPRDGCVDGCTCNGTGREKTGDGLSTVDCRCPDGCDCKASEIPNSSPATKQETPAPVVENVDDPPLVPVAPKQSSGRIECRNGQCYWIENGRRYRVIR